MQLPKYIDTHAHLNFDVYNEDRHTLLEKLTAEQTWVVNVGTGQDTSKRAVEIAANTQEGVYATVGLHPVYVNKSHDKEEGEVFDRHFYENLLQSDKVLAIGECGLDFFHLNDTPLSEEEKEHYIKKQRRAFGAQIELALEFDKPLMIHCRDAYKETIQILLSYQLEHGQKLQGNFHFFAGTKAEATKILDMGFNVSFTGVITFAKDYEELVRHIPLDRMMSETDCPYVTPTPYRGERNEPVYVSEVVKKIAEIKGEDLEKVSKQLVKNAIDFYKI